MWRLIVWWIANSLARSLPLRVAYALAVVAADITYLLWGRGRACARETMRRAMGEETDLAKVDKLARQSFRNFFKYVVDFMRLLLVKPEHLRSRAIFHGAENVEEAIKEGKGLLFVGLHQGNYDIGALLLRQYQSLNVVAEPLRPSRLNQWVQGMRAKLGIKVIPRDRVWEISTSLRRRQAVALLIDSPSPDETKVTVRFLGGQCQVPAGPALLALRTGANIVTGWVVRQRGNGWSGFFNRCIRYHSTGDLRQDIEQLTQRIMDSLEEGVRKYPDQWYIFHPLWVSGELPQEAR